MAFLRVLFICALAACARAATPASSPVSPPPMILGEFQDDYGGRHTVSTTTWVQHPNSRYRIVRWEPEQRFLIAQNDAGNRGAPGKWTRIDWVSLSNMPPYEWAFCFSAFDAATQAAAEATTVARPETPRTGCNGHPYSRMRRP